MPTTTPTLPRENDADDLTLVGAKRQPFGVFPPEAPRLLVPHPDMWLVHEASMPEAVAERAGLSPRIFEHWCREYRDRAPWLPDWLYGGKAEDQTFPFTEAMHAFRVQSQVLRISEATKGKREPEGPWGGSRSRSKNYVTKAMIDHWLALFDAKHPDPECQRVFRHWLIRGQETPGVRVITPDEFRRCSAAWNAIKLAHGAGVPWPQATYERWFDRPPSVVPAAPNRPLWLKWLYSSKGYRQAPAFVVTPRLQIFRRRGTRTAIAEAAGLDRKTVKRWRRDPATWKLVEEAVEARRQGKSEPNSEDFHRLSPATWQAMSRYAEWATRAGRCRARSSTPQGDGDAQGETFAALCLLGKESTGAVDISPVWLDTQRREARAAGVEQVLRDYLDYKKPYQAVKHRRQYGLIEGGLFVLPPAMCLFHEAAANEWRERGISELERLPGFWDWFAAWVTPQKEAPQGRALSGAADVPAQPQTGYAASQPASVNALSPAPPVHPRWDANLRKLCLEDRVIKAFGRQPADNQVKLIEAFDRAGWPVDIPNPFTITLRDRTEPEPEKLRETCKSLNASLPADSIRFCRDGAGGVRWEPRGRTYTGA